MLRALARVLSSTGFPYGSGGILFKQAQFGRDALEVAEDLLEIRPDIAWAVIGRLATLQGTEVDPRIEEEPGKIHHEYRALIMDDQVVSEDARAIFHTLASQWRLCTSQEALDRLTEYTLYPAVDATPLYLRLVGRYCTFYGAELLHQEYTPLRWRGAGPQPTIQDSVQRAVDWIAGRIERSDLGLLEFRRLSAHSHRFQAWKDGATSYLHPNGGFANYNAPIASIEVQGLAYDALTLAPVLQPNAPEQEQERWLALAQKLQKAVFELFWMPDERYFAIAIDRDPRTGNARQVKLITANPGELLDSSIFDTLEPARRKRYLEAIVERILSDEFLTPVGIRATSLVHQDLLDYPAYQSSHTVWHKETYDVAKGTRRQGFPNLADDLENRLLNAVNVTGAATEFLYVLPDNRVDYGPFDGAPREDAEEIIATNVPEIDQAWSISAALAIKWYCGRRKRGRSPYRAWQSNLETRIWKRIEPVPLLRTRRDIERASQTGYRFKINTARGWELERSRIRQIEL